MVDFLGEEGEAFGLTHAIISFASVLLAAVALSCQERRG